MKSKSIYIKDCLGAEKTCWTCGDLQVMSHSDNREFFVITNMVTKGFWTISMAITDMLNFHRPDKYYHIPSHLKRNIK